MPEQKGKGGRGKGGECKEGESQILVALDSSTQDDNYLPPAMTKSAPPPKALEKSPGQVQPPSEMTWPPSPCAASAHSRMAES